MNQKKYYCKYVVLERVFIHAIMEATSSPTASEASILGNLESTSKIDEIKMIKRK